MGITGCKNFKTEMGRATLMFGGEGAYRLYGQYKIVEMGGAAVGIGGLVLTIYGFMANKRHELDVSTREGDIIGLSRPLEKSKRMKPFEFQNWVCGKLHGRLSENKFWKMGIDGWLIDGRPIQVIQSENIGRNVIDDFETAMCDRGVNKDRGVVVAFSFDKGAYAEVARAKLEDGLDIELKTVGEILRDGGNEQ